MPTISIIIATRNREGFLVSALDGILMQTRPVDEIIIVDDASTDGTGDLVQRLASEHPSIRGLRNEENVGPAESRCRALERCASDFVVFHDDDDVWTDRHFIESALTHMGDGVVCVSANAHVVTAEGESPRDIGVTGRVSGDHFLRNLNTRYSKPLSTFTTVFRRSALIDSGILESRVVNDYALYLRALTQGDIHVMPEDVGAYVRHAAVISDRMDFGLIRVSLEERFVASQAMGWSEDVRRRWNENQFLQIYGFYMASAPTVRNRWRLVRMLIAEVGVPSPRTCMRILVLPVRSALGRLRRRVMGRRPR